MKENFSSGLLVDLYLLTMAQGYWETGKAQQKVVFHLSFRKNPFQNGYTIFGGLQPALEAVENFNFSKTDLDYLASLEIVDNKPLFSKKFLRLLKNFKPQCQIHAFSEGSVVFAGEPVMRISGPLLDCQLLESLLLNIINFQSLIATKATRIMTVTQQKPIYEFGLRRAQGINGAVSASRAAFIGGCSATSNLLAGKLYKIPVIGTHSHSWVLSFASEQEAFKSYIQSFPDKFSLLVDTYTTLSGVKNAIEVVNKYSSKEKFIGIRLDSGDLTYFSNKARKLLDKAGYNQTKIIVSNDLDEYIISSLNEQKSAIDIWAIGTKLVTAANDAALNGVYKLSALYHKETQKWQFCCKLSEDPSKINNPSILQIRRFFNKQGFAICDAIYNQLDKTEIKKNFVIVNPLNHWQHKKILAGTNYQDLLLEVMKEGKISKPLPSLQQIKQNVTTSLSNFDFSIKRLINPHIYPVGLEEKLYELKKNMIINIQKNAKI